MMLEDCLLTNVMQEKADEQQDSLSVDWFSFLWGCAFGVHFD